MCQGDCCWPLSEPVLKIRTLSVKQAPPSSQKCTKHKIIIIIHPPHPGQHPDSGNISGKQEDMQIPCHHLTLATAAEEIL